MQTTLLWTLQICGVDVRVIETDTVPTGCSDAGCYLPSDTTIYVRRGLAPKLLRDTLIHEWLHAYFDLSGVGHWMEHCVPFTPVKDESLEELLCRFLSPGISTAFDGGLLGLLQKTTGSKRRER